TTRVIPRIHTTDDDDERSPSRTWEIGRAVDGAERRRGHPRPSDHPATPEWARLPAGPSAAQHPAWRAGVAATRGPQSDLDRAGAHEPYAREAVMKFRVERDQLADAVAWTAKSLPTRPSVPVLAGVLLRVNDGVLTISG